MPAAEIRKYRSACCLLASVIPFFFLFSCGITEYNYLEPPLENTPATGLTSPDPLSNQFDFFVPNINTNGVLIGYVVYYKIYNNTSSLNSALSTVKNANALYSSQGMETLKRLGYQPMFFLIASTGRPNDRLPRGIDNSSQRIQIRLFDQDAYLSGLFIDQNQSGIPLRWNENYFTLFKPNGELVENFSPSTDLDVSYSAGSGTSIWYVNAYAAAFGQTPQFSPVYSQLAPLGVVRIPKPN